MNILPTLASSIATGYGTSDATRSNRLFAKIKNKVRNGVSAQGWGLVQDDTGRWKAVPKSQRAAGSV